MREIKRIYHPIINETSVFYQTKIGNVIHASVIRLPGNHLPIRPTYTPAYYKIPVIVLEVLEND